MQHRLTEKLSVNNFNIQALKKNHLYFDGCRIPMKREKAEHNIQEENYVH